MTTPDLPPQKADVDTIVHESLRNTSESDQKMTRHSGVHESSSTASSGIKQSLEWDPKTSALLDQMFTPTGLGLVTLDAQALENVLESTRFTDYEEQQMLAPMAYMAFAIHYLGAVENLTFDVRQARGTLVCHPGMKVRPIPKLNKNQVDQVLERALLRGDFNAVRAFLNHEAYEIPIHEPNDIVIPVELDSDESDDSDDIEIQITPEEYEMWNAPLEPCEPEPAVEESALYKAFTKSYAQNIPFHLEHAIRQRDIATLRMLLRLYGHDISSHQPHGEDVSSRPNLSGGPSNTPEVHQ